jgi:hypothetical protein
MSRQYVLFFKTISPNVEFLDRGPQIIPTNPIAISLSSLALFIWLIIRLIQLVFSAGTVFFSHKKSANSVFQPAYNSSRTAPFSPFYPSLSTPDGTSKRIDGWLRRPRVTRLCMKGGCGER